MALIWHEHSGQWGQPKKGYKSREKKTFKKKKSESLAEYYVQIGHFFWYFLSMNEHSCTQDNIVLKIWSLELYQTFYYDICFIFDHMFLFYFFMRGRAGVIYSHLQKKTFTLGAVIRSSALCVFDIFDLQVQFCITRRMRIGPTGPPFILSRCKLVG